MTDLLDIIIDNPKCNTCGIPKYLINYPSLINKNEIQLSNIQLISSHIHTKYIDDINNTKLLITIIQNLESKLQENITESLDDQKFKDAVTNETNKQIKKINSEKETLHKINNDFELKINNLVKEINELNLNKEMLSNANEHFINESKNIDSIIKQKIEENNKKHSEDIQKLECHYGKLLNEKDDRI